MGIGLVQQNTRCSNRPGESGKELTGMESSIESKTELIQIRLIVSTASVVGSKQKRLEVPNCSMNPFEITGRIFRCIDCDVFQSGVTSVAIALDGGPFLYILVDNILQRFRCYIGNHLESQEHRSILRIL